MSAASSGLIKKEETAMAEVNWVMGTGSQYTGTGISRNSNPIVVSRKAYPELC
jgi:hypothetical protein